ncbi:hypothetical protein MYP_888 [Sporocytophaga myxococcoides]|uniref:Secretion system C-terminal sorting domain-containing protein n=1 Tax=Sporocytophaga myxococcoides TaxID=153721 RepID=A0A098L9M4_9BACT|nr:hypothetical protein MYP_888 [Sporocytophaga myxococcoides]
MFGTTNKTLACTGRDIVFTDISITSIVNGVYYYTYEIKNVGTVDITLGEVVLQNYVSTDNQVGGDAPAGGSFISHQNVSILSPGETFRGTYQANPFPQNPQSTYPYLIVHVSLSSSDECDKSNNYFVGFIQISTAIPTHSMAADAKLNWDVENKSFIVNEWSGAYSEIYYSIFSVSGVLMLNGIAQRNESTPLKGLSNGVYLLHLSDGDKEYLKRITYFR